MSAVFLYVTVRTVGILQILQYSWVTEVTATFVHTEPMLFLRNICVNNHFFFKKCIIGVKYLNVDWLLFRADM
jgi:hypothetical protein